MTAISAIGSGFHHSYPSALSYDETLDNLRDAIANRGLNISNELHAGEMLNRTGPDLGYNDQVFAQAGTLEFCSAVLSHQLIRHDPSNMVLCPFTISVYQLNQTGEVWVAYRRIEGGDESAGTLARIRDLIEGIIRESIE